MLALARQRGTAALLRLRPSRRRNPEGPGPSGSFGAIRVAKLLPASATACVKSAPAGPSLWPEISRQGFGAGMRASHLL